jgi:hypothetical protein
MQSRKCRLLIDGGGMDVILAPTQASRIVQYEFMDLEWAAIGPFLPNNLRGVLQVNDRRAVVDTNGLLVQLGLPCHVFAKATDWSYVNGYAVLRH